MRSFWSRVPMLRLAIAILSGISLQIIASDMLPYQTIVAIAAGVICVASLIAIIITANVKNVAAAYRLRLISGAAIHTLVIAFSFLLSWFNTQSNYPDSFFRFLAGKDTLVVLISEPPVVHNKTITGNAWVKEVNNSTGHFTTTGNMQLNFARDTISEALRYGDELLITSRVDTTISPQNPGEFNFKNYLAFHNVYHRSFVKSSEWAVIAHNRGNTVLSYIYKLRDNFLAVIALYVKDKNDFGVASAIMLGYRDYINADIMRAYASSGAVHVLSVSGLHVSVMFFMLNFLLRWMDNRGRKMAFAKAGFIIAFMWFYACLTGLSPPVLRSAMMFTLIQLGHILIRNVNTYNIVAGSAVLLMLWNPFIITDAGFQLSYIAVFGIIYLQPKIANLLPFTFTPSKAPLFKQQRNWLIKLLYLIRYDIAWLALKTLDFFWQLIAASVAAQIATLPLCLLYFYQFPNLFLFSNLVVIPLGNLLLFAGTALFALAHIPIISSVAGWFFNANLVVLNKFIFWVDTLPFALTKGICISVVQMFLLYMLILLACWLTEERKNKILISALAVVLLLITLSSFKKFEQAKQKEVVVYSVAKQKAIAFITGRTLFYDIDSALYNNQSNMQYNIYHHWWQKGITEQKEVANSSKSAAEIYSQKITEGRIILFEGRKILLVDSLSIAAHYGTKIKLHPDLVIISGSPKVSIPVLKKSIDFSDVVFDSSCKPASRKRWKKDCSNLNINFWDVNTDGAYIWDF